MSQQKSIPAVFMRGGTSKGVFFHERDLPPAGPARDRVFSLALGSPDPYGRQLDGMGGGISSLSKAVVINRSNRADADVDYTFGQVDVASSLVDYGATCGNLSGAVGPFAVDEGLIDVSDGPVMVRVYNTNTDKVFQSHFSVVDGKAVTTGDMEIAGVAGSAAAIRLDFLDPAGARTGKLLPTGQVVDQIHVADLGAIDATLVDATNPCVFVQAQDLGVTAGETPEQLDRNADLGRRLESIRAQAGVMMGFAPDPETLTAQSKAAPKIAIVAPPQDMDLLDHSRLGAGEIDLSIRMISMGICHKAVPLTGGMCAGVAAAIKGGIVHQQLLAGVNLADKIRLGTPSGMIPVGATVNEDGPEWSCEKVTVYRTARRLMDGQVYIPNEGSDL